jgi:hypothetical protein
MNGFRKNLAALCSKAAINGLRVSRWLAAILVFSGLTALAENVAYREIDAPPHLYHQRKPQDKFSKLTSSFESGAIELDRTSEKAFLVSLLKALEVPVSSQMLVFSTTSLQLSLISPSNPRALYFNEEIYVGYVPGGRIEVVSIDPEVGAIFYIFDIPKADGPLNFDRSNRCMNCHANEDTGYVPGLVIKSVLAGPGGGSLDAFRIAQTGHQIPFEERFGGWYLTGADAFTNHFGNVTGRFIAGSPIKIPNPPGQRFSYAKYPSIGSDILPQLLHEHQAGFINRVVEAGYRARTALHGTQGKLTAEQETELDDQARLVARYITFADEAALPSGGVAGDEAYRRDFPKNQRLASDGSSLKAFDLKTRLFKHRCSYMIYTPVFEALPRVLKQRIYRHLNNELALLPSTENAAIRKILKETLSDLPANW